MITPPVEVAFFFLVTGAYDSQQTLRSVQEQLRLDYEKRQKPVNLLAGTATHEMSAREQTLELERDGWHERATQAEERVKELEQTLAGAQKARQLREDENTQLELEIAARNRIIVEQQEALNEFVEPTKAGETS